MGRYNGKYSFDTFSHEKPILSKSFWPESSVRYPPWNKNKLGWVTGLNQELSWSMIKDLISKK